MLNEPASSRDERPFVRSSVSNETLEDGLATAMRSMVAEVLSIEEETFQYGDADASIPAAMRAMGSQVTARFTGRLLLDSEKAYDQLDRQFTTIDHIPLFREENGKHVIIALEGRINPAPRAWWPNLLLFVATLFCVLFVGLTLALQEMPDVQEASAIAGDLGSLLTNLWRGIPYALSILVILGAHELGHYFAARRHNLAVTLPYFIPVPPLTLLGIPFASPFGTMGAFIQLRQPMRNRKMLFDVGAAGPLAGLLFAVPILFIGLAGARVGPVTPGGIYEGDSVLYAFAKIVTFGEFLPSNGVDVYINSNQLAWAGWTGLLVSALNLIPIGQLDGGHILYALIGERARWLYYPLLAIMIALVFVTDVWLLWVILLLLFGRVYATPLDMITPLDQRRRVVGVAAMIIFFLIFVPTPLTPMNTPAQQAPRSTVQIEQARVIPVADLLNDQ
jgi:hypothetical protein